MVEPNPDLHPVLESVSEKNDCGFELVPAAYSSDSNDVRLSLGRTPVSSQTSVRGGGITTEGVSLQCLTDGLDEFCLICDVEGSERDLLANEIEVIRRNCRAIVVEFQPEQLDDETGKTRASLERSFDTVEGREKDVYVFKKGDSPEG